jgi:hypothetical protein
LEDPPKFTQIFIFGLKIYHLATLVQGEVISVPLFALVSFPSSLSEEKKQMRYFDKDFLHQSTLSDNYLKITVGFCLLHGDQMSL